MADSTFTPALVDALLDQLSTNQQFRDQFLADPKAALLSLGAPADFHCGECMYPKKLASMDDIRRSLAKIRELMLGKTQHQVFNLESSVNPPDA